MKRTEVVAVRLTPAEAAQLDARRGPLTRSAWLRLLLLQQGKRETQDALLSGPVRAG